MDKELKIEIYEKAPPGFKALVEVSACYLEMAGKILLLKQGLAKQEAGAWGVPAGKIEKEETPLQAACRELFEETGIALEKTCQMHALGCLYIRKPTLDYVFHMFQVKLEKIPPVSLSEEHQSYQWVSLHEVNDMDLMSGAKEALAHYRLTQVSQQKVSY